jgi:hypothetical protein
MSRDAGFLLMRLLYGELIGVNVHEWLFNNQIKSEVLNEIVFSSQLKPKYSAMVSEYLRLIAERQLHLAKNYVFDE